MKKLVFFIAALAIVSCKNEPTFVKFSGKITNPNGDKIAIIQGGKKIKTISIGEGGIFSDTINNVEKGYYSFSDGKESSSIYLQNGYDMNLELDTKEFDESIKYTGNGSNVNNYLASKYLIKEQNPDKDLFALNESEFLAKVNETSKALQDKLATIKDANFNTIETKVLKFEKASNLNMYQGYHGYLTKDRDFKISDDFPNAFEGIVMDNDEDFKNIPAYQNIVMSNFGKKVSEIVKTDSITPLQEVQINVIKTLKGENIKNGILKNLAYNVSARNEKASELYKEIMELSTDDEFKKTLTKQFDNIKKTAKGQNSPSFDNYENHKGGTTSLSDLKGKYVYVDVWATWCGPCKREIPFLKEVEKKYHGKNIEFVSISVDTEKDHDKWVTMVNEKELGGIQLFSDANWKSKFVTDYGIKGIPRFILIDPNGNIVSASAPRPSSDELIKLFDKENI